VDLAQQSRLAGHAAAAADAGDADWAAAISGFLCEQRDQDFQQLRTTCHSAFHVRMAVRLVSSSGEHPTCFISEPRRRPNHSGEQGAGGIDTITGHGETERTCGHLTVLIRVCPQSRSLISVPCGHHRMALH
jgi:hypothetical protein